MKPDLFKYLPPEIMNNILLRLSVRSIAASKCVCKPWLHLLETDDFIKSHFSKSVPALAFTMRTIDSYRLIVCELEEDELDPESRYDPLSKLDFPHEAHSWCSANGLIFLYDLDYFSNLRYICNPITREYLILRCPQAQTCGFGVSKISGQYKVVTIDPWCLNEGNVRFSCHVYTLGTGFWRRVEDTGSFDSSPTTVGTFVHGNLHWMVTSDSDFLVERVSCFDLETECFSSFTVPPLRKRKYSRLLYALRDSLGFCDQSSEDGGVDIWMMKEYGVEESWVIQYVITPNLSQYVVHREMYEFQLVHPVKVFENGDTLMMFHSKNKFMYYSEKRKAVEEIDSFFGAGEVDFDCLTSLLLTPSLISLKTVCGMENVISF